MKNFYTAAFSLLSVYLILLIPVTIAESMGNFVNPQEGKKISFSPVHTRLAMSPGRSLGPLECSGERYRHFAMFVDDYIASDKFDIKNIKATIANAGQPYDVSGLISCSPTKNLVSNEEIKCAFDMKSFESMLPSCPPQNPYIQVLITAELKSPSRSMVLSMMEDSAIISAGAHPSITIENLPGFIILEIELSPVIVDNSSSKS